MSWRDYVHHFKKTVVSNASVVRALRIAVFAVTPAVFVLGMQTSTRLGASSGEILIGVLGTSTLAVALTILGLLLPRSLATLDR